MTTGQGTRSVQEQAVAAWVHTLNHIRVEALKSTLADQAQNLERALASITAAQSIIDVEVVQKNLGGAKGMHGFIAEVAEVGIGNARNLIIGQEADYVWVNNSGPVDLLKGGLEIQQKFAASKGLFSLGEVAKHLTKYPDFVHGGGVYQVPADHFETIRALHAMSPEEAGTLLSRSGEGPSLKQWKQVQAFFAKTSLSIDALEPSHLEYGEVQQGTYAATLSAEQGALRETDRKRRDHAFRQSRPTLREGVTATAAAAAVEGATELVLAIAAKRRSGIPLREFTLDDWREIGAQSGVGLAKGGIRGASLYALTNATATPAAVASSAVTAMFGVAAQAHAFRAGRLGEREFIEAAELVCLEAAISAISSLAGQTLIPIPVLGAVIGNAIGTILYRTAASGLSTREQALLGQYVDRQRNLTARLETEHRRLVEELDGEVTSYLALLHRAFAPDLAAALRGSVDLARSLGVPAEEVLDTPEKTAAFFLD